MSWIWALSPILTGSILAAPALAYAASRLRSRWLWISSIVFAGIFVASMVVFGQSSSNAVESNLAVGIVGGSATLIALAVRKRVFEVDVVHAARQQRRAALRVVALDPVEAIRLKIGRVDVPDCTRYPDGGLIDVNNIPLAAVQERLGIERDGANRLVAIRREIWGFDSAADLYGLLDLEPQHFDAVRDRLIFLPYAPMSEGPLEDSSMEYADRR